MSVTDLVKPKLLMDVHHLQGKTSLSLAQILQMVIGIFLVDLFFGDSLKKTTLNQSGLTAPPFYR